MELLVGTGILLFTVRSMDDILVDVSVLNLTYLSKRSIYGRPRSMSTLHSSGYKNRNAAESVVLSAGDALYRMVNPLQTQLKGNISVANASQ